MNLSKARKKIDKADRLMAKAFIMRMDASCEIAKYKKENGKSVTDPKREKEVFDNAVKNTRKSGYSEYFCELTEKVIELSKKLQEKIINGNKG